MRLEKREMVTVSVSYLFDSSGELHILDHHRRCNDFSRHDRRENVHVVCATLSGSEYQTIPWDFRVFNNFSDTKLVNDVAQAVRIRVSISG